MLQNVTWDELVDLRWRKRSAQRKSFVIEMTTLDDDVPIGVDQMIGFFNMVNVLTWPKLCSILIDCELDLSMGCLRNCAFSAARYKGQSD